MPVRQLHATPPAHANPHDHAPPRRPRRRGALSLDDEEEFDEDFDEEESRDQPVQVLPPAKRRPQRRPQRQPVATATAAERKEQRDTWTVSYANDPDLVKRVKEAKAERAADRDKPMDVQTQQEIFNIAQEENIDLDAARRWQQAQLWWGDLSDDDRVTLDQVCVKLTKSVAIKSVSQRSVQLKLALNLWQHVKTHVGLGIWNHVLQLVIVNRLSSFVFQILDELGERFQRNETTYALFFSFAKHRMARCGPQLLLRMWQEMVVVDQIAPTLSMCGHVVAYYALTNHVGAMMAFVEEEMPRWDLQPNHAIYNTLIRGFSNNGMLYQMRLVMRMMADAGLKADITTYNHLIFSACQHEDEADLNGLYNTMIANDLQPTKKTFASILAYYGKQKTSTKLLLWLDKSRKICPPDLITYTLVIGGLCRMGDSEAALRIFKEMDRSRHRPDVVTCNRLLGMYAKTGDVGAAVNIFRRMTDEQHPIPIEEESYMSLLRTLNHPHPITSTDTDIVDALMSVLTATLQGVKDHVIDGRVERIPLRIPLSHWNQSLGTITRAGAPDKAALLYMDYLRPRRILLHTAMYDLLVQTLAEREQTTLMLMLFNDRYGPEYRWKCGLSLEGLASAPPAVAGYAALLGADHSATDETGGKTERIRRRLSKYRDLLPYTPHKSEKDKHHPALRYEGSILSSNPPRLVLEALCLACVRTGDTLEVDIALEHLHHHIAQQPLSTDAFGEIIETLLAQEREPDAEVLCVRMRELQLDCPPMRAKTAMFIATRFGAW